MATREEILREFDELASQLEDLRPRVHRFITDLLRDEGLNVQMVDCRVKPKRSLQKKLLRPDYQALSDITDLLGVRILTYFSDHVDDVSTIVRREFKVDEERSPDKRAEIAADRFGYVSRHFVVALSDDVLSREGFRNQGYDSIWFEIQIRTVLQHAWAEIEHDLGYKTDEAIPREFRRRFSRVAGLLEVADDEFPRLRDGLSTYKRDIEADVPDDGSDRAIDQISLTNFVRNNSVARELDFEIADACGARLEESDAYVGRRAVDVSRLGVKTIADLERQLRERRGLIEMFAAEWLETTAHHEVSEGISLFFLALVMVGLTRDDDQITQHFVANGIRETRARELAQRVARLIRRLAPDSKD